MSYSNSKVRLKTSLKRTRKRDRVFIRKCKFYVILIDNIIQLLTIFFSLLSKTLLDDIEDVMYLQIHYYLIVITKEEIQKVIQRSRTNKVSSLDEIFNRIL